MMRDILKMMDKALTRIEESILSLSILTITVMTAGNAVSRNFFGQSWSFASEISELALYTATFMGISYAARKGRHITMSALFDNVPFLFRKTLAVLIPFVTAVVLFIMDYFSYEYVQSTSGRVTSALRLPYYWMNIWAPIGFLLGGIQFLRNFWVNVRNRDVYLAEERKDYQSGDEAEQPQSTT
ncbi:TRAP transporter small permease [Salibacterium qingdaonense]|uniref:TRAP-type C4-dicarboxylate transport system, small permease component n=1 Tax=Salibacterium qingdaonense TaxID=266892 RepID=A0A1I4QBW4_9BACI|nr:TRAP transporter small permease [Salibacterium qingdaonense]SFM37591.1 TRAP-type C4-dicarboxylate transport system, small permease component [Salibacterium qingdaonense]